MNVAEGERNDRELESVACVCVYQRQEMNLGLDLVIFPVAAVLIWLHKGSIIYKNNGLIKPFICFS